jgi:hypothetical protein
MLAAIDRGAESGTSLRDILSHELFQRRHPYVELVSGAGVPFYTVRNERIESFTTVRIEH